MNNPRKYIGVSIENPEEKENQRNLDNITSSRSVNNVQIKDVIGKKKVFAVNRREKEKEKEKDVLKLGTKHQPHTDDVLIQRDPNPLPEINSIHQLPQIGPEYLSRENEALIRSYGSNLYNYAKILETQRIPGNFLLKQRVDPETRMKMVDWMIEVLAVYKSEHETFFLSVNIMDMFIARCPTVVKTDHIHLIGITSMFMASKFEDVIPLRMQSVVSKIGHDMFSEKVIKAQERKMLDVILFDNLICTSTYEFIKTYFYDFTYNNKNSIKSLNLESIIDEFETSSIYMSKMILHFEYFYNFNESAKAVACVMASFCAMKSSSSRLTEDSEKFLREWIKFLISESSFSGDLIMNLYNKIYEWFSNFEGFINISHNLKKYYQLNFK